MVSRNVRQSILAQIGALLIKSSLVQLKKEIDYSEAGGAPLLGVDGVVIISHGGSSAKAIRNAVRQAASAVENDVNGHITRELQIILEKDKEPDPVKS